jgi:hypothetical protein
MSTKFKISKTANVILVYQYIRIKVYQYMSRVISLILRSMLYRLKSVSGYATPLGKPIEKRESLDSREWQREPAGGEI